MEFRINKKNLVLFFLFHNWVLNAQDVGNILNQSVQFTQKEFSFLNEKVDRETNFYSLRNKIMDLAKEKMGDKGADDYEYFYKWYNANFLYSQDEMIQWNLTREKLKKMDYWRVYDRGEKSPLNGYFLTKKAYRNFNINNFTIRDLEKVNKLLLDTMVLPKGSTLEEINLQLKPTPGFKGKVRWFGEYYNAYFDSAKVSRVIFPKSLFKNKIWTKPVNPFLKKSYFTQWYLNPSDHFNFKECTEYYVIDKKTCECIGNNIPKFKEKKSLPLELSTCYRDWISGYLNWSIKSLKNKISKSQTNKEIIDAIAEFHYNLVSIHPFGDGNGRTTRTMVEILLEEFNLPPPLHYPWGVDVGFSIEDFKLLFQDAIIVSKKFHENLLTLMQNNVPYSYVTSQFLTPGRLPWKPGASEVKIIPKEFVAWMLEETTLGAKMALKLAQSFSITTGGTYEISDAVRDFIIWKATFLTKKRKEDFFNRKYLETNLPQKYW